MKLFLILCLAMTGTFAGTVTHTLEVAPRDVMYAESDAYAVIELDLERNGTVPSWTATPGHPLLPVISGNVLIPAGAVVEELTVTPLAREELGTFRIHPVQPMRPLSELNSIPFVGPDAAVYGIDEAYPTEPLTVVPAGSKAGYRIAGFLYCPFEYRPASGRLTLVTRARVEVKYRENTVAIPVLTESQRDLIARDVAELVVNPQDVSRMAPPAVEKDAGELDVVVFTNSALAPALAGLRNWLMRKGYFTEIVQYDTLSTTGRDDPEKMREFLKDKFANNGLKYVILAGDYDKCPLRYGYLPNSTYNVPADMYFADLDGDWDANGNGRFGEMTGDSVDLFQDIYVGRLPLDSAADAANFLRKDTTYEIVPDTAYLDNVILPSEVLWANIDFHGGIVNTNIARMLNAQSPWEVDSGLNMGPAAVISGLNAGRQLFHFAGHGSNTAFGSTFNTGNISSLTNVAMPCITMTMACNCGWFDTSADCLGELLVNATNGGAVSTLLNARYGWGAPPCQGPNSNMNCHFFRNFTKGMTQGKAHGLARDFQRNESFSQMTTRWAMYTNTLQGDPTMTMWRQVPQVLAALHPDTVTAMPQQFPVEVSCGYAPVPNARVAVTHMGELLGRATTNANGMAWVPLEVIEDTWTLKVTVTGQDVYIYEAMVYTTAGCAAPLLGVDHCTVDDFNGRLDPGEETDVFFVVKNSGNLAADSVAGVLRTTSPYVTILDSTAEYGSVGVGDTARGDAYAVRVAAACPHGHEAGFELVITTPTAAWHSNCELTVGLPHAGNGIFGVLDTGNFVLAVPGNGGIGTTQWRGEGFGWIYDKNRSWSNSCLMHGALMFGTDTGWVVDNYYGAPNWKECPLDFDEIDTVRMVFPPELGHKEFYASFSDANHPAPRSVRIDQRVYGCATDVMPTHDDFTIYEYRIHNGDASAIEGLYVAVACDFRTANWSANDQYDYAGTDSTRNLAYIKSSPETTALGIRHIYPAGMGGWANCINHSTHINNGFTKAEKMQFMDGTLRQTTGTTRTNWHAMSSSGPYTIPAGDSQIVAFVLVGGRTVNDMLANSDTAAAWYDPPVGIAESGLRPATVRTISVYPRVFTDGFQVSYQLSRVEPLDVALFDANGRRAASCRFTPATRNGTFAWRPRVAPGVYFIRVGNAVDKVLKVD